MHGSSAYHHNRAGGRIPATAGQGGEAGGGSIATAATGMTSRSTLLDVIRGVGAMDDEEALAHRERVEAAAKMPKFIEPCVDWHAVDYRLLCTLAAVCI